MTTQASATATAQATRKSQSTSLEDDHGSARALVWDSIGGALKASQIYLGDRLELYGALREMCTEPGSSATATDLADRTGLNRRWLREWMAQQAASGILVLLPGEGDDDDVLHYRLPRAMATVLADNDSEYYDVSMVQLIPALVERARVSLPRAFKTGVGQPYDNEEISKAIDRHHNRYVKHIVLKELIPSIMDGEVIRRLEAGARVADDGCGGGGMLIQFATTFPKSSFHGFEVSEEAVSLARFAVGKARLKNVVIHGADQPIGSNDCNGFDFVLTYDVLHDAANPMSIINGVKNALKPNVGWWILGDVLGKSSLRDNVMSNPAAAVGYAFSTCLCMSCGLSSPGPQED